MFLVLISHHLHGIENRFHRRFGRHTYVTENFNTEFVIEFPGKIINSRRISRIMATVSKLMRRDERLVLNWR